MKYLEVTLRYPDELLHPMQEFIRNSEAVTYDEMITWSVRPEENRQYMLYYVEADLEAYRRAVSTVETIVDYQITPIDDESAHVWVCERLRPATQSLFGAFTDRNLIVVPPIRFDHEAAMQLTVVGDGSDIQTVLEDIPPEISVTVTEIGTYNRRAGTIARGLTDRQMTAVETAFGLGYYDVPREVTLDEVATALSCTRSTVSVLLRRAEREVFAQLLERHGDSDRETKPADTPKQTHSL